MSFENIRAPREIPYYDQQGGLISSIRNGAKSRGIHPVRYAFRRFRNYLLLMLAYFSPVNRVRVALHKWRGVNIGKNVYIGMLCFLDNAYPEFIYLEEDCSIIPAMADPVIIKKGAILAVRSIVLPGVTIGTCSIVSAGSVVNRPVPDYTLVAGNPAKKVTTLKV
jgi:acetyltransferase-like isoleucine patch superfamily enzyme